jgi:hypothetical protein
MMTTTSICFTRKGVLNPEAAGVFTDKDLSTLVVFSDGSEAAYEHICSYDFSQLITNNVRLAVAKVPMWDLRVLNQEGKPSQPNYVFSDQNKADWFATNICAPLINIAVSDITSKSATKVQVTKEQVALICDMSLRFWQMLKVAEDHLAFPAIAIDALTRQSRSLTRETIDVPVLRKETGLQSLDYDPRTDMLSLEILGDLFTVKLSVIDKFFRSHILPFFNKYQGRRYRLEVSILGMTDLADGGQAMSYGELGRNLDQLKSMVRETRIGDVSPMDPVDLLAYAKKVPVHAESCRFWQKSQTISDFFRQHHDILVGHADQSRRPAAANNDHADLGLTAVGS